MGTCPFCGGKIINGRCKDCGYRDYHSNSSSMSQNNFDTVNRSNANQGFNTNNINQRNPNASRIRNINSEQELSVGFKVLFVLISFLVSPFVGLIISIVLLTRHNPSYKSFGLKLLIMNIVIFVLIIFVLFVLFFMTNIMLESNPNFYDPSSGTTFINVLLR